VKIPAEPGSYIVIGRLNDDVQFTSGPFLGQLLICGYYLYSGSAFGPGGLRARITRHLNPDTKKFWHFDHLKANLHFYEILYSSCAKNQECEFILALQEMEVISFPFIKFGSGDCRLGCPAHLAWLPLSACINSAFDHLEKHGFSLKRLSFD